MPNRIHELVNQQVLDRLREPLLDAARGLPASIYTEAQVLALEREQLFPSTWFSIAFDTDVPSPGDAVPLTVYGLPLLLVRDQDRQVHVLHNVCRHRATKVVESACSGNKTLKCPYHGWVYGLDGELKATPFWDGTPEAKNIPVDVSANSLVPVQAEVWNHIVFVNLTGNAGPLIDYLRPMDAELAHLDIPALEPGHRRTWEFAANWKLVMENWEVYHHVWVHEGVFDRMSDEVDLKTGEPYTEMIADGNCMFLRYLPNRPQATADDSRPKLPSVPRRRERSTPHSIANAVLPNTTVTISDTTYAPAIYVPVEPGVTQARMAWYFEAEAATGDTHAAARDAAIDRWLGPTRRYEDMAGIRPQDHHCMELQQQARSSPVADDVKFSITWEANVRFFQDWYVRQFGL